METTNENIRQLLEMLDHPEAYTEQEIHDIINRDEDTRETYRLIVEAKRSSRNRQTDTPVDVDAAWQRFEQKHYPQQRPLRRWLRIAAIFIGIAFISGIAFAVIQFVRNHSARPQVPQTEHANTELANQEAVTPVRFDDVRLDSILTVVSSHYGKEVSFRSEEAKGMKFIMAWNPDSSLTSFIDGLNMFDGLLLTIQQDTIFVETTELKEDAE